MLAEQVEPVGQLDGPKAPRWPGKHDLFGIGVSATNYAASAVIILNAAANHVSATVTHLPVHGIVTAALDAKYRSQVNSFDIVAPDGQPVRWALNHFYHVGLTDRVYGPELMLRLCEGAAEQDIGVYLFGSSPQVIAALKAKLIERFPRLQVVGCESPPFRPLTAEEDAQVVERINDSGAGLVFLGLGCPRQDIFAFEHRRKLKAVQMCVGAAFDFIAENKRMAPAWMQRASLEWLFRLTQEPRRLWKRYLFTNTVFLLLLGRRLIQHALCNGKVSLTPELGKRE
jgi:exopolysaccharide biosynthesis WecB/TagA/CpsF family protein